jgi:hypothetical protein
MLLEKPKEVPKLKRTNFRKVGNFRRNHSNVFTYLDGSFGDIINLNDLVSIFPADGRRVDRLSFRRRLR